MIESEIERIFGNKLRLRVSGICIETNRILLIKHTNLGEGGYLWSPPGGGLHFGESVESCLKREFEEETGFQVSMKRFLFVNEFLVPPLHAIELFFEVEIVGGTLLLGKDPEMQENSQIIKEIAFLNIETLQQEPSICVHSMFRDLKSIGELLEKNGYFKS
ncbi:MAG: NUDIX hydrolase [Raineya sp.]|jgi:8-oxo-dGTP diphosphatase|nr:NUDIX hydrolase [Raineya sp.]